MTTNNKIKTISKVWKPSNSGFVVTIPAIVRDHLKLEKNDIVEIEITKIKNGNR